MFFFKFGMLQVLGIDNLHKKFCGTISKIVDFFWCQFFGGHFFVFLVQSKTEKLPLKVRQYKKIYNFWDSATKFFVQVVYTQNPKHTKFGGKIQTFLGKIIWWNYLKNVSPDNYAPPSSSHMNNNSLFDDQFYYAYTYVSCCVRIEALFLR